MHELPLNGRNFTQLLILQPGVNPVDTSQGTPRAKPAPAATPTAATSSIPGSIVYKPSVNGAGNRSNAYLHGWHHQYRRPRRRLGHPAHRRYHPGIQGAVAQQRRAVRQRAGLGGEYRDQERHQSVPRLGLGIRAQPDLRRPQSVHRLLLSGKLPRRWPTSWPGDVAAGTQTAAGASAILSGTPRLAAGLFAE